MAKKHLGNNCTKNFSAGQVEHPPLLIPYLSIDSINQGTNVQIKVKATDF